MAVTDYTTTRLADNAGGSDSHTLAASEPAAPFVNDSTHPRDLAVYEDPAEGAVVDRVPAHGQNMEGNGALNRNISTEHKDIESALRPTGVSDAEPDLCDSRSNVRPPMDVASHTRGSGSDAGACQASSDECEFQLVPKDTTLSSSRKKGAKAAAQTRNRSPRKPRRKATRANPEKTPVKTKSTSVKDQSPATTRSLDFANRADCTSASPELAGSPKYEEKIVDDTAAAVEKAEETVRKRKGKGKEVELHNSESASTGSKRRRDEEIAIGDISEVSLGPGPSTSTTKRTRTRLEAWDETGEPVQPTRRSTRIPALVAQGKIKTQLTPPTVRRNRQVTRRSVQQVSTVDRKRKYDALTDSDGDTALEAPQMPKRHRHHIKEPEKSPEGQGQGAQDPSLNEPSQSHVVSLADAIRIKWRNHEKSIRLSAIRHTLQHRRWTDPLEDVIVIEGVASTSDFRNSLDNTRSKSQPIPMNDVKIKETVPISPEVRHASPSSDDEVERLLIAQDSLETTPTPGSPGEGPSTSPRSTASIPADAVVIDLTGDTPVELTGPRQQGRRGPGGDQRRRQWPQTNGRWYHSPPPDETGRQRLAPEPSDGLIAAMQNGWTYGCRSPAYSRYTKYKIW